MREMNISHIETFLTRAVHNNDGTEIKPFLFVCLETRDGLQGWGEAFITADNSLNVESLVRQIGRHVVEMDSIDPREFYNLHADAIDVRGFDFACAISAIEISLWDLYGKQLDRPVRELIGSVRSTKIPVYANTWNGVTCEIEALVDRCRQLVDSGHNAIKIYPLKYGTAEKAGECVEKIRRAVTDSVDILIDVSAISNPKLALACAKAVTPYNPYWFEEPHTGDDLETLASIRRQVSLPIVTGEKQVGRQHFANVLKHQAADILNPDIAACGGLLEILAIAAMAEKHAVSISPHCWNSMTVALAAMLHVCAVMPNADKAEIFPAYVITGREFCQIDVVIEKGFANMGTAPGLGVEMNIKKLRKISSTQVVSYAGS